MSDKPETVTIKFYYGTDPAGFYWPGSAQKRKEMFGIKRNDPAGFEAVYQGRPGKRIGTIFVGSDFDYYQPPEGLELGISAPLVRELMAKGSAVFQSWDTAFSTSAQSAYSVCITGMFVSCDKYHRGESAAIIGDCPHHYDVIILDVFRRKMDWGDLLNEAQRLYHKWEPQAVVIEKRATGISLVQTLPAAGIPVLGIEVGSASKGERALNRVDARGAGSVVGWCRGHRVKFPIEAPWLSAFVAELKDFDGAGGSQSDQVDAFVHLVTHAIRMSSQGTLLPSDFTIESIQEHHPKELEPNSVDSFLQYLGESLNDVADPYAGMCGRCSNYEDGYCVFQRRSVVTMDSCFEYTDRAIDLQ